MYSPYNNHFVLTLLRRRFPMVVGEWSLALGGRGKAALPGLAGAQTSFFGFSDWGFETPYRWGYHDI